VSAIFVLYRKELSENAGLYALTAVLVIAGIVMGAAIYDDSPFTVTINDTDVHSNLSRGEL
jgi:hypothetical protein